VTEPASPRPRRRRPPRIAVDSLLIVFSILLALAVNAWWSGRQDQARVEQALALLDAEIESNRAQVADLLPYHEQLLTILAAAADGSGATSPGELSDEGFEGFRPPSFLEGSWESALAGGVPSLMDFETVSVLGRIYSFQRRVDRLAHGGLEAMTGPGAFNPENFASLMVQAMGYVNDLRYAEQALLVLYDEWIAFRNQDP
jgi:hypothetical protein